MNNRNLSPDGSFDRLLTFAKNHRPTGGFSNMYIIRKYDENDNIIDEYYGMNMFTDNGMKKYFTKNESFPTKLYIGNGTGSFNYTTQTLLQNIPNVEMAATVTDTSKNYAYPLYYDPAYSDGETGLITCMMKYMVCYFPRNIDNITGPFRITEYGIGDTISSLWTHSWIYDITGKRTEIQKDVIETLEFEVYMCYSYYEHLITNGWANGRYTMITSMRNFFDNRMYEENVRTYKRNNVYANRTVSQHTRSAFTNNSFTNTTLMQTFTMYNGTNASSGYIDGFIQYANGFLTLEPQQLETPEDVVLTNYHSLSAFEANGFSQKFGHAEHTPITQIDVSSVNMFNHKGTGTDRWTNEVDFYNNPDHWYCETSMMTTSGVPLYYSNNNTYVLMYVYQNVRTDDPIIGLNNTLETVYATNKYWDPSSWIRITDYSNIPTEAQTARYWITPDNNEVASLQPIRKSGEFHLCLKGTDDDGFDKYNEFTVAYGAKPQCDNYDYGWYMYNNTVYVPGTNSGNRYSFNIGTGGATSTESMTYGRWLITFNSKSSLYLTDMNDLSTIPTPSEITPTFDNTSINLLTACYRSKSDTGLICLQSTSYPDAVILDLRGEEVQQYKLSSTKSTCVWGKNQVAYILSDDTKTVRIYDHDTNAELTMTFTLPDNFGDISFMLAHTNFIWVSDGVSTYVLDIRDGSIVNCVLKDGSTIISHTNTYQIKTTAVDDVIIVYNYASTTIGNAVCFKISDPITPFKMTDFNYDTSDLRDRIDFDLRYVQKSDDNTMGTLVLTINRGYRSSSSYDYGRESFIIDFGQYLYDDTISRYRQCGNSTASNVLYGENIMYKIQTKVPLINYLPQKIVGTTKTIGTLNYIKNISGKEWNIEFTNIPPFGSGTSDGVPPGKLN